jgi:hypothetical protein
MVAAAPTCTPRRFVALDSRPSSPKLAHGHTDTPVAQLVVWRLRDSAQKTAKPEIDGCVAFRPGDMCSSVAQPRPPNPRREARAGDTPRPWEFGWEPLKSGRILLPHSVGPFDAWGHGEPISCSPHHLERGRCQCRSSCGRPHPCRTEAPMQRLMPNRVQPPTNRTNIGTGEAQRAE